MSAIKILIVDDETEIIDLIRLYLEREGFEVHDCTTGLNVLEKVYAIRPDLIILDVLLPGLDGMEVCRQLRKSVETPILFISCKSEDIDIVLGLGMGGDDYMTKPFSPSQLVARVKAHLRRSQLAVKAAPDRRFMQYAGLEIDVDSHIVRVNGVEAALSAKEFDLLKLLASSPNRVFRLEQLYEMIWDADSAGDTRTLLVHISNLRKKIESNLTEPKYIITVRGVGYKFNGTVTK